MYDNGYLEVTLFPINILANKLLLESKIIKAAHKKTKYDKAVRKSLSQFSTINIFGNTFSIKNSSMTKTFKQKKTP